MTKMTKQEILRKSFEDDTGIYLKSKPGVSNMCFNKKTHGRYFVLDVCIEATNSEDGCFKVIYENDEGQKFVRQWSDFKNKFEVPNANK